jgi:hypothetical protein
MDYAISITDSNQLLGLQRALAAQNAGRDTPLTEAQFLESIAVNQCAGFAASYLVTRIAPLDFQMRFTADERVAIRTAAQTSGTIADYLGLLNAAPVVNLTDPLTTGGVQHLEAAGLIAQGRAAEILAL